MFRPQDDILAAVGIMVLLIGTATGSAYAMIGLAAAGLMRFQFGYSGQFPIASSLSTNEMQPALGR